MGGLTWVGERGPELMGLPEGTRIYSNQQSRQMMGQPIYNYNFNVDNIETYLKIEKRLENQRMSMRMGYIKKR
jgi:hypothetical protein